jgi:thiamine biosynthesis protein ThiS
MKIQLNGEVYELDGPATLADLLARLDVDPRRVAVEQNFVVVKRDRYAAATIADGDQIEIVNFVGGG